MFTYKMVELDIQKLFAELDHTRSTAYKAYISATMGNDGLTKLQLAEVFEHIVKVKALEMELKIKIDHMSR